MIKAEPMIKDYPYEYFEQSVNQLIDQYFNEYKIYNEETINDFFTELFYELEDEKDLDIANEAEKIIRNMVFND